MDITNTRFKKRPGKLWTFISDMSGSKTQVDYILVNRKWKNSVKNVEAYSAFSSIGSDHRVVTAKIKLSLRMSKSKARKKQYDWSILERKELQELYTISVQNRFAVLAEEGDDVTNSYGKFVQANQEATEKLIPEKKKKKKNELAENPRVRSARQELQNVSVEYQLNPSAENQIKLQGRKDLLAEAYNNIREEEISEMITQVENADAERKHGESWRIINLITGRKSSKKGMIKARNKDERISKWYEHFSNLLGKVPVITTDPAEEIPPILHDLGINDAQFTLQELESVKKTLRKGKAAGPDNIPPDVLKCCNFDNIILSFANELLIHQVKPQQWSEIDLIPLPKSGDLSDTGNYRGISLSSIVAKIVNKMILHRIQPKIDVHLRRNQNGFRPARSTTAHILALRRLIEGVKAKNLKSIIIFVDFKKAFDSVH